MLASTQAAEAARSHCEARLALPSKARHGPHDVDAKYAAAGPRRAAEKRAQAGPARAIYASDAGRAPGPRAGAAAPAPSSGAGSDGDRS